MLQLFPRSLTFLILEKIEEKIRHFFTCCIANDVVKPKEECDSPIHRVSGGLLLFFFFSFFPFPRMFSIIAFSLPLSASTHRPNDKLRLTGNRKEEKEHTARTTKKAKNTVRSQ